MNEEKMAAAWALVEKAASLEEKATRPDASDNIKRLAAKQIDRKLEEAAALEAEAVAE